MKMKNRKLLVKQLSIKKKKRERKKVHIVLNLKKKK